MPADGVAERQGRSLRRHVVAAARALDHAVGRQLTRVRVLVDVRTPMNAAVLRPMWATLVHDSRIELAFVAEQPATVAQMLAADGVQCPLLRREEATWKRWDLVLTADAWNHTPLRRCRRRVQFFHGVAGKYDLDNPSRLGAAGLDRFDRVAFINASRMNRYVGAGVVSPGQAVLVGYPKLDDLLNGRWAAADVRRSLGLDPALPTVLFAPTFSVAGALHVAGLDIIRTALERDVNVVVKLHDRSMTPDAHHTAGIDWPAAFAVFASHPRFALAHGADVAPIAGRRRRADHGSQHGRFRVRSARSPDCGVRRARAAGRSPHRRRQVEAAAQHGGCRTHAVGARVSDCTRLRASGAPLRGTTGGTGTVRVAWPRHGAGAVRRLRTAGAPAADLGWAGVLEK